MIINSKLCFKCQGIKTGRQQITKSTIVKLKNYKIDGNYNLQNFKKSRSQK